MTMASTTIKDTDFVGTRQLLLGLLLSSLSVSPAFGTDNSTANTVNTTDMTNTSTTLDTASTTTPIPTVITTAMTTVTTESSTPTPPSVSSSSTPPTSTIQSTSTGAGSTSTVSTVPSSAITTSTGINSSVSTASMGNTTGWTNGTTPWSNSSMSMISCPSFMCNYSDCYSMYTSQNATMCSAGYNYCELIKQMGRCYTVSCSASCSSSCVNASQSNCSVNCCNSTGCLNNSFASMMMTTTVMPSTTTTATTTQTPATTVTGNKCHTGKCNGTDCYRSFSTLEICVSSQLHCQLKKETVGTNLQWTAGCTTNCSGQSTCKAATQPPCYLECCNATMSSCLWLNGTLNVPSFATRGPQLHSELVISALVLFAISLML